MLEGLVFPESATDRDSWILGRRPQRNAVTADEPFACFVEQECSADRHLEPVATIFLTNRECPFRCTMCDLWRNTLTETVAAGAIPRQIDSALKRLGPARSVKLYNSGSFFDPAAIPPEDYEAIAERVQVFERVIVECHPALVGEPCLRFRDMLRGRLEVAMGLETVHRETLKKLNKRMTLEQFARAASFLAAHGIDLRVFLLVQPPFLRIEESLDWAERSLDFAFDCGATAATLIPTRAGNGAMEALAAAEMFVPPRLKILEQAAAYGLALGRGRVFTDLWEVKMGERKPGRECVHCFDARIERLRKMNFEQSLTAAIACPRCNGRCREAD